MNGNPTAASTTDKNKYVEIAKSSEVWQQIEASFALEGIELTEDNAALAGRLISEEITLEDALAELRRRHGIDGTAKLAAIDN